MHEVRRALARWLIRGVSPASSLPSAPRDWTPLVRLARREGLAGLLLRAVEESRTELPPGLRAELRADSTATLARNLLLLQDTGRLARALTRCGAPALFLKGVALLETQAYPDPGCRAMFDVDLLVRQRDAAVARAAACSLGWRLVEPRRAPSRQPRTKQNLVRHEGGHRLRLEIHTHLDGLGQRGGAVEPLLGRARAARVGGEPALVPAVADMAMQLAVHWTTEGFPDRLRDEIDLLALVMRSGLSLAEAGERAAHSRAGVGWAALLRRAARDGLDLDLPAAQLPPDAALRLRLLDICPILHRTPPLLSLLLAESPADAALLALRVGARRVGDAWAACWEGTIP